MSLKEDALKLHEEGYNCSQSILVACRDYTGLDDKTALAISAGFGGGMRSGEVCGSISGAIMAMGMIYPFTDAEDKEASRKTASMSKKCMTAVKEKYGCVTCRQLKRRRVSCEEIIGFMAETVEELLKNEEETNNIQEK